ncbi:MAG: 1-(5-phosphoribosyl)-5-[(5-phosphoribosylamino)methylideneamino] imidazole-4-carboxamide isomerase [Polyangiaceae bacterium]|nr:1-(5-phosphoribosyl)-5-[(5-phosphoribosylamino)methylideneamino] imidazole-4-carboxamide isomerase [Polyangiaceae bacterium]
MKIIPAIDLRNGRVVRLKQGDFAQTRTFEHDPILLAKRYADAGADRLHVVDLDGARAGHPLQIDLMTKIVAAGTRVQAGGGVRSRADVEALLAAGIDRVVIGSVAVRTPDTFIEWLKDFGSERLCLAMDLCLDNEGRFCPVVDAWQSKEGADVTTLLDRFAQNGLRHVLTTDITRDGMGAGPNIFLYEMLAARWPQFAWIASGGVRDRGDVLALRNAGVAACVAGTALLDGTLALEEIAQCSRTG